MRIPRYVAPWLCLLVVAACASDPPICHRSDGRAPLHPAHDLPRGEPLESVLQHRSTATRADSPVAIPTFHIQPLRPVAELRAEALRATPPAPSPDSRKPDLVEVVSLDSTIRLDVRYATTNNFAATAFYTQPRAFLQRPAAEAVVRAHRRLHEFGFGILIHDAYRPWFVTKMFWDATPDAQKGFVADPKTGSRHNRGCAVDLTLYDLSTGEPVVMPSGYDEFSERASPNFASPFAPAGWRRDLLRAVMESEGFWVNENEWWHFDHEDFEHYDVLNVPFEELGRG